MQSSESGSTNSTPSSRSVLVSVHSVSNVLVHISGFNLSMKVEGGLVFKKISCFGGLL